MARPSKYSPEVQERAVRMVLEQTEQHGTRWAATKSIAAKIGCSPETLRKWIERTERDQGKRPGLPTQEQQRLKELEREVFELRKQSPYPVFRS